MDIYVLDCAAFFFCSVILLWIPSRLPVTFELIYARVSVCTTILSLSLCRTAVSAIVTERNHDASPPHHHHQKKNEERKEDAACHRLRRRFSRGPVVVGRFSCLT